MAAYGAFPNLVIIRLLSSVALALSCISGHAGQMQNYPFSVASEKDGHGHRIVARNDGPAPVSVKVAIVDAQSAVPDRPFPVLAVVPPGGGTLHLGQIGPALPGSGYSFRIQTTWNLGDFNAEQAPDAVYRLPYRDGSTFRIGQSPGGPITTHQGPDAQYAVDIPMPEGTPVLAARGGVVIHTEADQTDGAQSPDMLTKANEVRIRHADGTMASYAHLAHGGVHVYPGQQVAAGEQIGLAGSTGYSSGPHLHFVVQTLQPSGDGFETVSLPFSFYVGNPPAVFAPQFGMVAKAEYAAPGVTPGFAAPIGIGLANPLRTSEPAAGGASGMIFSFAVPPAVRAFLLAIPAWKWFSAMVALALLWFLLDRKRDPRSRRQRVVREPVLRSRPAEEPVFHGLTHKDRLILACGSDRRKAERLMEYENRCAPAIADEEAARRALERLRGDRG